jgi:hypothetical protein
MGLRFDIAELRGMSAAQSARAITHLVNLLLQAAGVAIDVDGQLPMFTEVSQGGAQ